MSTNSMLNEGYADRFLPNGRARIIVIAAAIFLFVAVIGGGLFWLSNRATNADTSNASPSNSAQSYRTIAKTELRAEPRQAAKLVVSLLEGTTVSGVAAQKQDGMDWLEITAVDGTKGFAPKNSFRKLGPSTASTELRSFNRRIIVSATVNLRETPSMSGKILGVADGGTRMVSDGIIQSEGEDWLRVPIDGRTTVFVMQRFTTADDDGGASDGFDDNAQSALGVRGFAIQITNVQATPMADARVVRALQLNEEVRIIGQTNAGRAWYVLRLTDGSQGFAPRNAIRLDSNASQWVYPDGTIAVGPNIPKGSTIPLTDEQVVAARLAKQKQKERAAKVTEAKRPAADPKPKDTVKQAPEVTKTPPPPSEGPEQLQPKEVMPTPGPQ